MQKSSLTAFHLRAVPGKTTLRSSENKVKSILHRSGEDNLNLNLRNLSLEHAPHLQAFETTLKDKIC